MFVRVAVSRKTASHKKFIEFQNRRTFSHESDNYLGSSSSSEDLKTMTEVLIRVFVYLFQIEFIINF